MNTRPRFYTISSVRKAIEKYSEENAYTRCRKDLCVFFEEKTMVEIFNQPRALREHRNIKLIKSRISNTNNNKGSRGGYRIYYYADLEKHTVTIIKFYSKIGPYGTANLSNAEEKDVINEYRKERDENRLKLHDIGREFSLQVALPHPPTGQ